MSLKGEEGAVHRLKSARGRHGIQGMFAQTERSSMVAEVDVYLQCVEELRVQASVDGEELSVGYDDEVTERSDAEHRQ